MIRSERENFDGWADELSLLSLSYFADDPPAAFRRDRTVKRPEDSLSEKTSLRVLEGEPLAVDLGFDSRLPTPW